MASPIFLLRHTYHTAMRAYPRIYVPGMYEFFSPLHTTATATAPSAAFFDFFHDVAKRLTGILLGTPPTHPTSLVQIGGAINHPIIYQVGVSSGDLKRLAPSRVPTPSAKSINTVFRESLQRWTLFPL